MELIVFLLIAVVYPFIWFYLGYRKGVTDGQKDIMQMHTRKKLRSNWRGVVEDK